jgi:hypothetical protein
MKNKRKRNASYPIIPTGVRIDARLSLGSIICRNGLIVEVGPIVKNLMDDTWDRRRNRQVPFFVALDDLCLCQLEARVPGKDSG